jgi:predicted N-formylglutamate amidohydrolase
MFFESDEPSPVRVLVETTPSPFLLTVDHASNQIPRTLENLGLCTTERYRHIAWDIGIAGVAEQLAERLNATTVLQNYSRLVIDCNRQPNLPDAFPTISETTLIPGNLNLSDLDRQARRKAIFDPYHRTIAEQIHQRKERGQHTIYVALHSFTPIFKGKLRPMHVAVLYNRTPRFAKRLAELLRVEEGLTVAENAPYRVSDETDYGVPIHAEKGGLDYVLIEIRQDLLTTETERDAWAKRLARLLPTTAMKLQEDI